MLCVVRAIAHRSLPHSYCIWNLPFRLLVLWCQLCLKLRVRMKKAGLPKNWGSGLLCRVFNFYARVRRGCHNTSREPRFLYFCFVIRHRQRMFFLKMKRRGHLSMIFWCSKTWDVKNWRIKVKKPKKTRWRAKQSWIVMFVIVWVFINNTDCLSSLTWRLRLKDQKEVKRRCVWSVWSGQVFNQRMYWRFKDSNPNGKRLEPSGWISQKHWIPGPVVSSKRSSAADAFVPHFHKIVVFDDQQGTICAAQTIRLSQKSPYSGHFCTPNIWIKYILNWFELLHSTGYFRVLSVKNCLRFHWGAGRKNTWERSIPPKSMLALTNWKNDLRSGWKRMGGCDFCDFCVFSLYFFLWLYKLYTGFEICGTGGGDRRCRMKRWLHLPWGTKWQKGETFYCNCYNACWGMCSFYHFFLFWWHFSEPEFCSTQADGGDMKCIVFTRRLDLFGSWAFYVCLRRALQLLVSSGFLGRSGTSRLIWSIINRLGFGWEYLVSLHSC